MIESQEKRIRVLVVDDSLVVRRVIGQILDKDPGIEVVGTAPNGRIALRLAESLKPDLITLDYNMPDMNGLEVLRELHHTNPRLPVVVLSSLTQRGASLTVEMLSAGATDYCPKPSMEGGSETNLDSCARELLFKIHSIASRRPVSFARPPSPERHSTAAPPSVIQAYQKRVDVVAIAISTGGPLALCTLIPKLPANLPVPVLIVQHMPPSFTGQLARRLGTLGKVKVCEAHDGQMLRPGEVYVAPGGFHMTVAKAGFQVMVSLNDDPPEQSVRPAADVLFRSLPAAFSTHVLGVVMTGMGFDGLAGSEAIVRAGGQVIAQDEASSVVWSMPGNIVHAGLSDTVLPLEMLADEIVERVRFGRPGFKG